MIEKIGKEGFETLSEYSVDVIRVLKDKKKVDKKRICVGEVGIGIGATAVEIVKNLGEQDKYYFFGFEEDVAELNEDLKKKEYCRCSLYPKGNTHKTFDSYCWSLGKMLQEEGGSCLI